MFDSETSTKQQWLKRLYVGALCYAFLCVGIGVYTQYTVKQETTIKQDNTQQRICNYVQRTPEGQTYLLNTDTVDGKTYENSNIKLTSYIDTTEKQTPAEYVRTYLIERQKTEAQMENVTVCSEQVTQTACIGYYKYYGTTVLGNAVYTTPVLTVVYAESTADGMLKQVLTTRNKQYDAQFVENAVTDFLYCNQVLVNTDLTTFDMLSITDVTGTYVPQVKFEYTAAKYFEFDSTTGTIKEYRINDKGAPTDVYIPETIGGVTVRSIGEKAFSKYKDTDVDLHTVVLPDTITTVGSYAFSGCSELTRIRLSNNLTVIGDYAFSGCTALQTVDLPDSITALPPGCFYGDTSLETVNGTVKTYAENTFMRCDNLTQLPNIADVTS